MRDVDEEESLEQQEQRVETFLKLIEKVRKLDKKNTDTYERLHKRDPKIAADERKKTTRHYERKPEKDLRVAHTRLNWKKTRSTSWPGWCVSESAGSTVAKA